MRDTLQRLQFMLERFIVRGPFSRLLVMAAIVATVAAVGGGLVWLAGLFEQPGEAVWWAFLRLTDPGYLGDDEGAFKRVVSTGLTLAGYVVFMGALIAVMSQWFQSTMSRIQSGVTPVFLEDHFLVLGWNNRTAAVVRELLVSESRVRRFYQRLGKDDRLRVVILADSPPEEIREDLRRVLGKAYSSETIIVRRGSALHAKYLMRSDFLRAAAAVLPAEAGNMEVSANLDAITIKTLLSIDNAAEDVLEPGEPLPLIVAELTDDRKIGVAKSAYSGPLETLATDRIIARLMVQNIRHRGVSSVYGELLGHEHGNEIYAREWRGPSMPFGAVAGSYPNAVPIGFVRVDNTTFHTELRPELDETVRTGDRIVLISDAFDATEAGSDSGIFDGVEQQESIDEDESGTRNILLLGWNRKVPVLLDEFDLYRTERFEIDMVSMYPIDDRKREIDRRVGDLERTQLRHFVADFTSEDDLQDFDLGSYDQVVLVASDWLDSDELSDARTLLGHLVLHAALDNLERSVWPAIVVELLDPENEDLLRRYRDDVVVSPMVVSHMLTHVALRRELGDVFAELFGPHGSEIFFRVPELYGIEAGEVEFDAIRRSVAQHGDVAIGFELNGETILSPDRGRTYTLDDEDRIVVLTAY